MPRTALPQKNSLIYPEKRINFSVMNQTADIFKALAHHTRLQILFLLLQEEEVCVCRIMTILELPQSTASRHLGTLKNAGLIADRRDGTWVHYSLARGRSIIVDQVLETLGEHLSQTVEGAGQQQKLLKALQKKDCA
jgi:ArsR family transcriptional regulator